MWLATREPSLSKATHRPLRDKTPMGPNSFTIMTFVQCAMFALGMRGEEHEKCLEVGYRTDMTPYLGSSGAPHPLERTKGNPPQ